MARKALFPSLLATAFAATAAAATAYADPASHNPAQAWIARIVAPDALPAQPGATAVRSDGARDFLARFETPSFSPAQPVSRAAGDEHPDRDFIARLSSDHSAIAEGGATPGNPRTPSYSLALGAGR